MCQSTALHTVCVCVRFLTMYVYSVPNKSSFAMCLTMYIYILVLYIHTVPRKSLSPAGIHRCHARLIIIIIKMLFHSNDVHQPRERERENKNDIIGRDGENNNNIIERYILHFSCCVNKQTITTATTAS